jgi:hypothetical protein
MRDQGFTYQDIAVQIDYKKAIGRGRQSEINDGKQTVIVQQSPRTKGMVTLHPQQEGILIQFRITEQGISFLYVGA